MLLTRATAHASPPVELSDIVMDANSGGFVMNGETANDYSGWSVSGAGDVNGDGLDDLVVGAFNASSSGTYSGTSYVVFGKADGTAVELSDVAGGIGGFVINGAAAYDYSGYSVSGAGDVNGDGLDDVIVGARDAGGLYGASYVVFGKASTTAVDLSDVAMNANSGGFVMNGEAFGDLAGDSVSGAGDVNGDGLDDLIIGAYGADQNGVRSGKSYVVFGKASGATVELSNIAMDANSGGFVMIGEAANHRSGKSASGAGDVNGDGLDDLIIGADGAEPNGVGSGGSYVVFGKASGTAVELSSVAGGAGGFAINGETASYYSGDSVSAAGDVNGDGLADLIVGAWVADPNGSDSGRSYVVFSPEPAQGRKLWVDFAHAGAEEGTHPLPFDTLQEALTEVAGGGTINIKGDTLDSDSPETFTGAQVIDQAVRITAVGGTVTIGNSAARDARRGGERP